MKIKKKRSVRLAGDVKRFLHAQDTQAREPHVMEEWLETLEMKYEYGIDEEISRQRKEFVHRVCKDLRYSLLCRMHGGSHVTRITKNTLVSQDLPIEALFVRVEPQGGRFYFDRYSTGLINSLPRNVGAKLVSAMGAGLRLPAIRINFENNTNNQARKARIQRLVKELDKCTEVPS